MSVPALACAAPRWSCGAANESDTPRPLCHCLRLETQPQVATKAKTLRHVAQRLHSFTATEAALRGRRATMMKSDRIERAAPSMSTSACALRPACLNLQVQKIVSGGTERTSEEGLVADRTRPTHGWRSDDRSTTSAYVAAMAGVNPNSRLRSPSVPRRPCVRWRAVSAARRQA